jgi:hypothetical protein
MLTQYCAGDKIEKNEIGRNVASLGRGEVYMWFSWGNLRERDHLEYVGADGRIILR